MEQISHIKKDALEALRGVKTREELEAFRVAYLGRKGKVPLFLRGVSSLPLAQRRTAGEAGNVLRGELEAALGEKELSLGAKKHAVSDVGGKANLDVSRPGKRIAMGHAHVLSQTLADASRALGALGFTVAEGPEVESEWYNFDSLNIPADHPARDMQDTFWLKANSKEQKADNKNRMLLRTHTSPVQMRWMETHTPPFRICCPGKCFRRDATDATHDFQFHQIEMLYVDKDISVANLKFVVQEFLQLFFKKEVAVRLRPSYFAFVEPGFEFDMTCIKCGGKKCAMCKHTGWIELGGAGMVHQNVFVNAGYARNEWQGMAFGFGLERLAILRHRIPDIRLFTGGDIRFIEQF